MYLDNNNSQKNIALLINKEKSLTYLPTIIKHFAVKSMRDCVINFNNIWMCISLSHWFLIY